MRRLIMTSTGYAMLLSAAMAVGLTARPAGAESPTKKAERDELAFVAKSDPVMAKAMSKARATLPDFLSIAAAPKAGMDGFAVKVAIREGEQAEYFWITPFTTKDGAFSGEINNTPRLVHSVKLGRDHHLRQVRDRRLDVSGRRQDEGQLHRLRAAQVGEQTGSRRIQETLRARL